MAHKMLDHFGVDNDLASLLVLSQMAIMSTPARESLEDAAAAAIQNSAMGAVLATMPTEGSMN